MITKAFVPISVLDQSEKQMNPGSLFDSLLLREICLYLNRLIPLKCLYQLYIFPEGLGRENIYTWWRKERGFGLQTLFELFESNTHEAQHPPVPAGTPSLQVWAIQEAEAKQAVSPAGVKVTTSISHPPKWNIKLDSSQEIKWWLSFLPGLVVTTEDHFDDVPSTATSPLWSSIWLAVVMLCW